VLFRSEEVISIVGSYTFNSGNTSDDMVSLWLDPSPLDFGGRNPPAASLTTASGPDISSAKIASFVFFQRSATEPASMLADELRIGSTWASVTPPPSAVLSRLAGLTNLGNGSFQFMYTNTSGQPGAVFASPDLRTWTSVGLPMQVAPGVFQFTDPAAPSYARRFYQLRAP
jgi:hypothetical protein